MTFEPRKKPEFITIGDTSFRISSINKVKVYAVSHPVGGTKHFVRINDKDIRVLDSSLKKYAEILTEALGCEIKVK